MLVMTKAPKMRRTCRGGPTTPLLTTQPVTTPLQQPYTTSSRSASGRMSFGQLLPQSQVVQPTKLHPIVFWRSLAEERCSVLTPSDFNPRQPREPGYLLDSRPGMRLAARPPPLPPPRPITSFSPIATRGYSRCTTAAGNIWAESQVSRAGVDWPRMPKLTEHTSSYLGFGAAERTLAAPTQQGLNFSLKKLKLEEGGPKLPSITSFGRLDCNGRPMGRTLREYHSHSLLGNGLAGV